MAGKVTIEGVEYQAPHDKIIVKVEPESEVSKYGIILMRTKPKYRLRVGTILSIGPGRTKNSDGTKIPPEMKEGDRILFSTYSLDTQIDELDLMFLREIEILAVIEDSKVELGLD